MSDPQVLAYTKNVHGEASPVLERRAAALCVKSNGTEAIDTYIAVVKDTSMFPASRKFGPRALELTAFVAAGGDIAFFDYK